MYRCSWIVLWKWLTHCKIIYFMTFGTHLVRVIKRRTIGDSPLPVYFYRFRNNGENNAYRIMITHIITYSSSSRRSSSAIPVLDVCANDPGGLDTVCGTTKPRVPFTVVVVIKSTGFARGKCTRVTATHTSQMPWRRRRRKSTKKRGKCFNENVNPSWDAWQLGVKSTYRMLYIYVYTRMCVLSWI